MNNKIILLSDGKKIRPQVHIKDVIKVYNYFINNDIDKNYLILNTGREDYNLTVGQIAKKISSVLKCEVQYGKIDKDKRSYQVNFSKLKKFIKFNKKENTIEQNVKEIINFYYKKKKNFFQNKNFYNLKSLKFIIDKKETHRLLI
jgi:nucleoside-diphosphate-sugar epimerase